MCIRDRATSGRQNSAMITDRRKLTAKINLYGMSSFHFYCCNQFKIIPLACTISVKNRKLNLRHLYLAPPLGVIPLEFHRDFWRQKTRVAGLLDGVVCVIPRLVVFVQYRLVTDRRADKKMDSSSVCLSVCPSQAGTVHKRPITQITPSKLMIQ